MSIRHMKKEMTGPNEFSFLCTEQFTYTTLFTFLQEMAASSEHAKCSLHVLFIITFVSLSVPILYFYAAKFSIKLFSWAVQAILKVWVIFWREKSR